VATLADLRAYRRFAFGLPGFLRSGVSLALAEAKLKQRLEDRPGMLLRLVEHGIYGNPASPYGPLLRLAGCELGDFRRLLAQCGVEGALTRLRREGVYVTFEEFKGRRPIVRGGRQLAGGARAFDNPQARRFYHGTTSGSTGRATRIAVDLDHLRESVPGGLLALAAHDLLDAPSAIWRTILPGLAGLSSVLSSTVRDRPPERWFSPLASGDLRPSLKDRLATEFILGVGRLSGVRLPRPQVAPLERPEPVVRWIQDALGRAGRCLLRGHVSGHLRVALLAADLGVDLAGATFWGGGEPPTQAKVAPILATGARFVPTYFLSEAGAIGLGCARPAGCDDMHVMTDSIAVIQHPLRLPENGVEVQSLLVSTLLPTAPKLMFNVETDDFGVLARRSCGCPLEQLGLADHVSGVCSHRKLTSEGMSLVGSDMVRVLEEVLPMRIGGTPLDYQLLEEEDGQALTRHVLLVHPRLGAIDEHLVLETVLEQLANGDDASELARAMWQKAATFVVRREAPRHSAHGKFMPLRRGASESHREATKAGGRTESP
jgi:hypothetical protein